ncbi:MAG: group 1 truncated hemoglobin [Myxococcales bacterium]|nr:group 1 truncated hemoglobin [Myxococcales bacterium]
MTSNEQNQLETTPYEALGGEVGLRRILVDFYDRLFADVMVGYFFRNSDKSHLVERQLQFMGKALGGPQEYQGLPLTAAHAPFPIRPGHFHRRHVLLADTLRDHHAPIWAAERWLELDLRLRTSILQKHAVTLSCAAHDNPMAPPTSNE